MDESTFRLDEASARQLLLVRAIEDVDTQGKLLSEVEREQLERDALAASRQGSRTGDLDPLQYLQHRARRLLAAVANRNPQLAALQDPEPWRRWVLWGLPVAACVLGVAIDRIDNPQQVNMLSPPLLGVLFWNIAVYVVLLVSALLPEGRCAVPGSRLPQWLARLPGLGSRSGRLRLDVSARFHQQWLQATGRQQVLWGKQLLHLTAAGWAVGIALSILVGGLVRQYRVGWESTLLDLGQVHAFLQFLFAPVVALLPFDGFSATDLQRMAFGSGAAVAVDEARRWVWMYVALLALVVVAPRTLLAGWAAWRRRSLGRAIRIDLRDPYFVQVLARVSPARITLGMLGQAGPAREQLQRMLRQAADRPPPAGAAASAWTLLTTAKGDVLRVFELPPDFQPPVAVTPAPGQGPSAAQAWLQDLMVRFKGARQVQEQGDALQAALADTDLVLLLPQDADDLAEASRLLHWVAQPALVLVPGEGAALDPYRTAVRRLGLAADVLALEACSGHWLRDPVLLEAIVARLAPSKRGGFGRLASAWGERNEQRFEQAMQLLAALLVQAARETEEAGTAPVGLRQLVDAGEREAAQHARAQAEQALLRRLHAAETATFAELVQLHRLETPQAPVPAARLEQHFLVQQPVDTPQAGMAGAATGAAMGAGIDLLAGGLTLGAATALGAMLGGGAAYVAAAWKNRTAPSGRGLVQLSDDMLQTLAEAALLAYLAVARRSGSTWAAAATAWRSEAIVAVEARRQQLTALWRQARSEPDGAAVQPELARELGALARSLLARL